MLSKIQSAATYGLDGTSVVVEVDCNRRGFPAFKIVGLPDKSVAEAKERVRSAVRNSGFRIPEAKIIVNLAPADVPKRGSLFDIPVALGILVSDGVLSHMHVEDSLFVGELSLDGSVSGVPGIVPIVLFAKEKGIKRVFIPLQNAREVDYLDGIEIFGMDTFRGLVEHLRGQNVMESMVLNQRPPSDENLTHQSDSFSSIRGQAQAKRALEISAAGGHNILLKGPPGTGKTLLAEALISLLPPLSESEYLEVVRIRSVVGAHHPQSHTRPLQAPHHTTSLVGLIGGGALLTPGEVTRAHRGVLFMDEMPEFSRKSIDALRQPLENGYVTVTRSRGTIKFPAQFLLVGTANPCPCGYLGHPTRECTCSQNAIAAYAKRISGPILDRIDIHVGVSDVGGEDLQKNIPTEPFREVLTRIARAHTSQNARYNSDSVRNAHLAHQQVTELCIMDDAAKSLLIEAYRKLAFSARSYFKTIKIAQTIADLEGAERILPAHIAEAIQYRI